MSDDPRLVAPFGRGGVTPSRGRRCAEALATSCEGIPLLLIEVHDSSPIPSEEHTE